MGFSAVLGRVQCESFKALWFQGLLGGDGRPEDRPALWPFGARQSRRVARRRGSVGNGCTASITSSGHACEAGDVEGKVQLARLGRVRGARSSSSGQGCRAGGGGGHDDDKADWRCKGGGGGSTHGGPQLVDPAHPTQPLLPVP